MERQERSEKDDAQKAKLIFLSLAALVTVLLIWSLYVANKARTERDAARQDLEMMKQDNAKLEQMLKDENQTIDDLKKKLQQCESKPKPKAKHAAKKKPASHKKSKIKKSTKHSRSR
ncbi:MAG: hypothetical protein M0Z89_12185 [Nitrospiraceae bacterium]|nr:hypothetical protein [Nitrospiraceae bacterium]